MDYKRELEKIEQDVNEKKVEKVRLEERKSSLEQDRKRVLKDLDALDIKESELDDFLAKEQKVIEEGIKECQTILNGK
jgi:hypothetical protein